MPISMTNHTPGMTAEAYDQAMADATGPLCRTPGFISHATELTPAGVTVTEVWDSREQWQQWYETAVRPHLPAHAQQPTVTELHNALGR